eukprot:719801-Pyramimonas_sp.AAC.1
MLCVAVRGMCGTCDKAGAGQAMVGRAGFRDALCSGAPSFFACGIPAILTSERPCPMMVWDFLNTGGPAIFTYR